LSAAPDAPTNRPPARGFALPTAWAGVAAVTVCAGWAAARAGVPSSYLFASLVAGLGVALARPGRLELPRGSFGAAQAVTGVVLGAYLKASALGALGGRWAPVALVSLATLALTGLAGAVLGRLRSLDPVTAALGMVAGGASGIVAMTGDLGGDDRLVAFMQYLRVLVIVLLTPLLVSVAFPGHVAAPGAGAADPLIGNLAGWALVAVAAPLGTLAGARVRLPAASLLGPLILAAAITLLGLDGGARIPALLREAAFAVIGLQIGLRFTVATVRAVGRLVVPVLIAILALVATCFGLAWVLSELAGVSLLDAYLATTPGGLYAVLAVAFGSGADTTFVLAVQGLRLFVMILGAPLLVRWLVRAEPGAAPARAR
jgi:membrane AbrB-like protein